MPVPLAAGALAAGLDDALPVAHGDETVAQLHAGNHSQPLAQVGDVAAEVAEIPGDAELSLGEQVEALRVAFAGLEPVDLAEQGFGFNP
jgi:hypothetical protein